MAEAKTKTDAPVFDFSKVNRGWSKRWNKTLQAVGKAQSRGQIVQIELNALVEYAGDVTALDAAQRQQMADYHVETVELTETINTQSELQEAMICEVLVSVPDRWIAAGAPDDLDWSDAESLDWLKNDQVYGELLAAMQEARSAKN